MSKEQDICDKCNKPVVSGQAAYCGLRHRGIIRHWSCHEESDPLKKMDSALSKIRGAIEQLKKHRR